MNSAAFAWSSANRSTWWSSAYDAAKEIFEGSGGTYGSPKIWILLVRQGWRVSVNTVAKLMAELGLAGRKIRRRQGLTRPGKRAAFPDFVRRDFTATTPDQVWCGDMTEIVTGEGGWRCFWGRVDICFVFCSHT
ncbi:IS3 family transposase [Streptomyces sp. NPDC001978]|uniref:IS3 family transposase n=1 Tax=Streptomyces sp. NPDC001978 TaxID=3364627 RepID=UPI0036C3CF84